MSEIKINTSNVKWSVIDTATNGVVKGSCTLEEAQEYIRAEFKEGNDVELLSICAHLFSPKARVHFDLTVDDEE